MLDFPGCPALNARMHRSFLCWVLALLVPLVPLVLLILPSPGWAVEVAPTLSDREIAERLARLETRLDAGLQGLRADIQQLRADMNTQNQQLREDMGQLRADNKYSRDY